MSIQILPNQGRYGNQLFLYFLSRILSKYLNYKIYAPPSHDLDYSFNQSDKVSYDEPVIELTDENFNSFDDFEKIINDQTPKKILLNGYFQVKDFYIKHKNLIKEWFNLEKIQIPKDHVAIHIRLGDLLATYHNHHLLPVSYYENALNMLNFSQLNICTDTPNHELIYYLIEKYNAKIFLSDEKNTISFLSSHNNLILSQGTFSFWAGFFCEGENIINAIPKTGWNSDLNSKFNLLIFNDERYKNIAL